MAAESKVKEIDVSLTVSSSASSVNTEASDQEYTEDFHSSSRFTEEEISGKSSNYQNESTGNSQNTDLNQFVDKKLQILKEKRYKCKEKSAHDDKILHIRKDLNPFWIKKLEILRQRNAVESEYCEKYNSNIDVSVNGQFAGASTNRRSVVTPEGFHNEIGHFQSAYERIKFENLREKCKKLLKPEIHSLNTCEKCQKVQDDLLKSEFYANCTRNVKKNAIAERLADHIQSTSSALLIANIINNCPKR